MEEEDEQVRAKSERLQEFRAIRFFPSLLAEHGQQYSSNKVILEDKRTKQKRLMLEHKPLFEKKGKGNKKDLSSFHPTKEITCLSDLREQIKKRFTAEKRFVGGTRQQNALRSRERDLHQGIPFRPCNPSEARQFIQSEVGAMAKTQHISTGVDGYPKSFAVPRPPESTSTGERAWKPSSKSPRKVDCYINAPDVESVLKDRYRLDLLRKVRLVQFKDDVRLRSAMSRNERLFEYYDRLGNKYEQRLLGLQ